MSNANLRLQTLGSNQTRLDLGDKTYWFSYETCVAFSDGSGLRIRRDHNYSVTTAKHMSQMGVKDWDKMADSDFERYAGL
jgi:hypothetical protein